MESKTAKLKNEFESVKKEIANTSYLKKGSITKCYQTCRNPNCRCHRGKNFKHGPYFLLTSKERNKTKTISVPEQMVPEIKSYIENFKLLKSKVKMLEKLSEEIIKIKIKIYRSKLKKSQ